MEQKDLNRNFGRGGFEPDARSSDDEVKIRVSRDGKWIIIRIPRVEQPVIKPVAYFEKIIERARNRPLYDLEKAKEFK